MSTPNAAQLAAQNRKIKVPKRRIAPGANPNGEALFAPGAPGGGGGLFGGSVQAQANNGFNFAAPVNSFGNSSVSFPPAVPGQGTPAKPDGFNMSFAGQPGQQGGPFGNTSTSFGGQPSNPFGQSSQPASQPGGFSFGQNNTQQGASNPFGNTQQNAQPQPASNNFNFGSAAPAPSNPFSFGASQQQPQQPERTPSFSFGSTAKTDANSFGQQQNPPAAAPASNLFGGFGANKPEQAKNPFGIIIRPGSGAGSQFGSNPGTREASPAPFSFGAATGTPAAEPKANPFQFGTTAGTPAPEKPASSFSFGQAQQAAETPSAAPTNNLFGKDGGNQTPGQNLFGNAQQNATPASNLFGAKPAEQPKAAPSLFGGSSQASQPASSFQFGQTSGTPAAAPANNLFGGAKPANPFANLNVPASGSSTPFGQASRSASPEKNISEAEKPAPAQSLFGGSQTPKPAASSNMFGAAAAPPAAQQQASKPNMFGQAAQEPASDAPKNIFGGLPQPPKAAPAPTESPAKPLFSASTPVKTPAPSLFAPPKQAVESPKPASQSLFGASRAPSKLSEVTNASPSPVRPSIEKPDEATSSAVVQKPGNKWKTSTKEIAQSSGALSKPVVFDHAGSIIKSPEVGNKRDREIYANKSEEEVQAMFELYVARSKNWDENEFLNPYSFRKIAMMCAQTMKSNMSEREQLETYCLVQIRIAQRRARTAFANAAKDEDEEKQLKIKYFYEYKEKDILRWAERQVEKGRRRAMDLQYEEEYEDRRRSKRTAQEFDDEERLQIEENPTAKRRKASPSNSPPKLLTNGESVSTTPRAPPPQKSVFDDTPAAGIQKNIFGSSTPAAAPPTPARSAPTPAASTPSAPAPSGSDTPKSKRKAENQFDKDDPFGELAAAASAKKNKTGSATASLFKSIVGKGGPGESANGTPERKIATPGKKADPPKANPFAALPGASSPAPAAKPNPFGALPSPAPKSPAKTDAKPNPFGSLPKPQSTVKAAAPTTGAFVFKPAAPPADEAPKANPFQLKPSTSTPAAPVAGGFKPTFSVAPAEANDAFAKAAAAAKKKARMEEMEKAKDEDYDSDDDEKEWEARYWKKKEQQEKEFAEKIKNPTLKVPSFGSFNSNSSFGANKPVEEAKDVSRSGTQSPNSVLDSHVYGSGKISAAAKNPFAHLSAATSPASSGKNDADDEEDKAEKSDEKSAEAPKGDLFSRTSFDPMAATPSLFGSVSKSADQTFKHDTPLKFAPTTTPATNIFGASTAAPATSLFGSKPASGTSTPTAAPKTAGFSFGGASTETPAPKTPSLFGNLNQPKISETPIPPPKPFSFLTNGKSTGITAGSSLNTSRATTPGLTTEGEATADEAAASGDADPETQHEQLKDLANGDEAGEEVLWQSKAKAMELSDNKWGRGFIGTLKVLKNKETKKVRYLMRLENGSIVLNKPFVPQEPKVTGKSMKMMLPNEEGRSLWNFMVKTPELMKELANLVETLRKD